MPNYCYLHYANSLFSACKVSNCLDCTNDRTKCAKCKEGYLTKICV